MKSGQRPANSSSGSPLMIANPSQTSLMRSIDGGQSWNPESNVLECYACSFRAGPVGSTNPSIYIVG